MRRIFPSVLLAAGMLTASGAFALAALPTLQEPVPEPSDGVPVNGAVWFRGTAIPGDGAIDVGVNDGPAESVLLEGEGSMYRVDLGTIEVGDTVTTSGDLLREEEDPLSWTVENEDVSPPAWVEGGGVVLETEGLSDACHSAVDTRTCGFGVVVIAQPASDEYGIAYYRVLDDEGETVAIMPGHSPANTPQTTGTTVLSAGREDRTECYSVVAVDVAENESTEEGGCIDLVDESGGCSCVRPSGAASRSSILVALALFAGMLSRIRKRG